MDKLNSKKTKNDIEFKSSLDLPVGPTSNAKSLNQKSSMADFRDRAETSSKSKTANGNKAQKAFEEQPSPSKKMSLRAKLKSDEIDLENLEKINEENIKSHSFRAKRNAVVIAVLSVFLVISIAAVVIYLSLTRVEKNCLLYVHGDVDAVYLVNDEEMSEFRVPNNISGECVLNVNIDLNIKSSGSYKVKFAIFCYNGDKLLNNVVVYEPNISGGGFTYKNDGYYHSKNNIAGSQTIRLCQGIALNEENVNISADQFKLEIHTYFERA